jgi:acetyl esterase/lipase
MMEHLGSMTGRCGREGAGMKHEIAVAADEPGLWLDTDITYANVPSWFGHVTRGLKLSLIRHWEGQPKPLPCIVWLCGGAWRQMNRDAHLPNFVELARRGFVIASVEYRTSNEATFPGPVEDVKAAIRFLRANAERFQIDPECIGVMGESAGGYLAAFVGVTREDREFDKGDHLDFSSRVSAVCPWYPPVELPLERPSPGAVPGEISPEDELLGVFAATDPLLASKASPLTYVRESSPPFLILHGSEDSLVPCSHGERLYEALRAKGVSADLYLLKGAEHAALDFYQPEIREIIAEFFARNLIG